jgi:hypothetical protein
MAVGSGGCVLSVPSVSPLSTSTPPTPPKKTAVDVLLVMLVENRSFRWLEMIIFTLILGIFGW